MPVVPLRPYWQTTDKETVKLYLGSVTDVLARLPEKSVHCVVTSPPYWGLRDYGTGTWEGGDPACDHTRPSVDHIGQDRYEVEIRGRVEGSDNGAKNGNQVKRQFKGMCRKCGAARKDQQLGSEPSPDCKTDGQAQCGACFVCAIVAVFREVRRVLRDDGILWLNLGDSYSGGKTGRGDSDNSISRADGTSSEVTAKFKTVGGQGRAATEGIPSGNLVGVPWRVALALQADGWVLRQDLIWAKKSPMPESVQNRCTKAHEYVFLLTKKGSGYYYDAEAIKETGAAVGEKTQRHAAAEEYHNGDEHHRTKVGLTHVVMNGARNKRSVWTADDHRGLLDWLAINDPDALDRYLVEASNKLDVLRIASAGYPGAHFATFPEALIKPMILAGTSERGCCVECGTPWRRVVEERKLVRERLNEYVKRTGQEGTGNSCANTVAGVETRTLGWEPGCVCRFYSLRDDVPQSIIDELNKLGVP